MEEGMETFAAKAGVTALSQACDRLDKAKYTDAVVYTSHALRVMLAQMDVARALLQLLNLPVGRDNFVKPLRLAAGAVAGAKGVKQELLIACMGTKDNLQAKTDLVLGGVTYAACRAVEEHWVALAMEDEKHPSYAAAAVALKHVDLVLGYFWHRRYGAALASLRRAKSAGNTALRKLRHKGGQDGKYKSAAPGCG